jgi:MFS family permease
LSPFVRVLVLSIAAIGFLFDTYELLMFPVVGGQAVSELKQVDISSPVVREWSGRMLWIAALCGGAFGLLGGWLIDRFGRKTVMAGAILAYSISPVCAAFSSELWMLILFRCTTFIGVCVEMVAAVTWLAELFSDKRTREIVIGWTLAAASLGGILVTEVFNFIVAEGREGRLPGTFLGVPFPEGHNPANVAWRFTLLTGLVPGALILLMLPFVPESQEWRQRKRASTLKRPSFAELFAPSLRRTTVVTAILSACGYAAAFGALQMTPLFISPGLPDIVEKTKPFKAELGALNKQIEKLKEEDTPEAKAKIADLTKQVKGKQKAIADITNPRRGDIQRWQEIGGLVGRIILAALLIFVPSRILLRIFLIPGIVLFPLTYGSLVSGPYVIFAAAIFFCGLLTVAQFSYLSEFLPRVFPLHLRGTGGSFASNVGGRMIGTMAATLNTEWLSTFFTGEEPMKVASAAAVIGGTVYLIAFVASFWLPQPKIEIQNPENPPPSSPLSTADARTAANGNNSH